MISRKDAIGVIVALLVLSSSISINLLTIDQGINVPFTLILEKYIHSMQDARTLVITDNETWSSLWSEIYHVNGPPPKILYVNFTCEWLIVVCLGTRPMGGYTLNITSISRTLLSYKVFYTETGGGAGIAMEIYPLQIVKISEFPADLPVSFYYSYSESPVLSELS